MQRHSAKILERYFENIIQQHFENVMELKHILITDKSLKNFQLDDPVSAFAVHGVAGVWGMLAVGLFSISDGELDRNLNGR